MGGDSLFRDRPATTGRRPRAGNRLDRVDQFRPAAVVDRQTKLQARVLAQFDRFVHLPQGADDSFRRPMIARRMFCRKARCVPRSCIAQEVHEEREFGLGTFQFSLDRQ